MSRSRNEELDFTSNIVFLKKPDYLALVKYCEGMQLSMASVAKFAVLRGLEDGSLPKIEEIKREKFQLRLPTELDKKLRKIAEKNNLEKQALIEFWILTYILKGAE